MDLEEFTKRFFEQQYKVDRMILGLDSVTIPRRVPKEELLEDMSDDELESYADEQESLEIDRGQDE